MSWQGGRWRRWWQKTGGGDAGSRRIKWKGRAWCKPVVELKGEPKAARAIKWNPQTGETKRSVGGAEMSEIRVGLRVKKTGLAIHNVRG